jgi:hypothetical protein
VFAPYVDGIGLGGRRPQIRSPSSTLILATQISAFRQLRHGSEWSLRSLVEQGLLERVRYRTDPDWYEYRLTQTGLDLFPAILTIKAWADQHLLHPKDPKLHVRHRTCGAELTPVVVCESCREPITAADVEFPTN